MDDRKAAILKALIEEYVETGQPVGSNTVARGAGLGVSSEEEVTSPSFTLVHEYGRERKVYHVDLYRVESARDFATLGLEDLIDEGAIVLVEWGEKLNFPAPQVRIRLDHLGNEDRRIVVQKVVVRLPLSEAKGKEPRT